MDADNDNIDNWWKSLNEMQQGAANDLSTLQKNGITHIVSLTGMKPSHKSEDITYKVIDALDITSYQISKHFEECNAFIEEGMKKGGVLVHCAAGVSRSSSIVIAYLMWKLKVDYYKAYETVKVARSCISPNDGFERQLLVQALLSFPAFCKTHILQHYGETLKKQQ